MKKLFVLTVCVLLLSLCFTFAHAVELTCKWTGASDGANYSDSYNWDCGVVPCNVGSVEFEVNVPNSFSVNVDTPSCEINELSLGIKTKLTVPGNIYTVLDIGYIDNSFLDVFGGGILTIPALSYSSTGLWASDYWSHTRYWDLFKVSDPGTLLDLSSVVSIDAGFNDGDIDDYNIHRITASSGGKIDLSGVETITGPVRFEDSLDFIVTGGSLVLGNLNMEGYSTVTVTGNESDPETATLEIEGDVILNKNNPATLILSEATLKVGGNLQFSLTDEEKFKAADILNPDKTNSIVHFDGSSEQLLEVGGLDVDIMWELLNNNNFGFGKLIIGQEEQETVVSLQDNIDNGNGCEALYLFGIDDSDPNGLHIHEGSTLILDGINVYALRDGVRVHINSLFPPGVNEISYDGGGTINKGIACKGDFDDDGDVDGSDLAVFASEFGRTDCSPGNPCVGDFCRDGDVDGSDLAIFAADFGRTDCP